MQTVKYINPKGQSIDFIYAPPAVFETVVGTDGVNAQIVTSEYPGQHGKTGQQLTLSDREITVSFNIDGKNPKDMYEKRQTLIAVTSMTLFPDGKPTGRIEYENDFGKWWIPCMVKSSAKFDSRKQNFNHGKVVFYCPNPFWRGFNAETNYLAYLGGGFEFDSNKGLQIPISNGITFGYRGYRELMINHGDSPAPVQITITGPATEPKIIKTDTGEYIKIRKPLLVGDTLIINTDPDNFNITIGNKSAYGYLDPESTPFQLDPGENTLEYQSGDDTQTAIVIVTAYPRFGGV